MILTPTSENIAKVTAHLLAGEIAAFGTETVYGLGADASNDVAVALLYTCKQRPKFNPLIAHYSHIIELEKDVQMNELARHLANHFWPGGLTLVLPKTANSRIGRLASAGLETAAVRIPSHPTTQALLTAVARPIVAPSANPSGRLSPVSAAMVANMFGNKIPYILDGGPAIKGVESTIVDLTTEHPVLLRHGAITMEEINAVLPSPLLLPTTSSPDMPKAPGMLLAHYAPRCGLRLSVESPIPGEALLTFADMPIAAGFTYVLNLSPKGDLNEAASNLFFYLHQLESMGASRIAARLLDEKGLGRAINDRLRRACAAGAGGI